MLRMRKPRSCDSSAAERATSSAISLSGTSANVGSSAAASAHSRNAACSAGVCAASTARTAVSPSHQASGTTALLYRPQASSVR